MTEYQDSLPTIHILFCGGTIGSVYDPSTKGISLALEPEHILDLTSGIDSAAHVMIHDVFRVGGADMTAEHWVQIMSRANDLLSRPEVAGVVVVQGTDTLEETAYFLDLTVTSDKPVVVVGALRASSEHDADGPRNLLDAVRVAASSEAWGKGALIVMNGEIHSARDVTKTHTHHVDAFRSLEFGALGVVDFDAVRFYRAPLRRQTISIAMGQSLAQVDIVLHYAGADGRVVSGLLAGRVEGLVLAGTGVGNVGGAMYRAVAEARAAEIPVVIATRTYSGRVMPLYSAKGRGQSLRSIDVVFADNLSPPKARILLMLAMTRTTQPHLLQGYFDH
jgi:L-asparaginase